jgi:hypothetical protein
VTANDVMNGGEGDGLHATDVGQSASVAPNANVDSSDHDYELTTMAKYKQLVDRLVCVQDELSTVTSIMVHLAQSYLKIVDRVSFACCQPLNTLLGYGELEVVVQRALATYDRHVLRARLPAAPSVRGDEGSRLESNDVTGCVDVSEWAGLLSSTIDDCMAHDTVTDTEPSDPVALCRASVQRHRWLHISSDFQPPRE